MKDMGIRKRGFSFMTASLIGLFVALGILVIMVIVSWILTGELFNLGDVIERVFNFGK